MFTTTHKRSTHIEAPVDVVFDYVKDPRHFFAAFPQSSANDLSAVNLTQDGVGSTYEWSGKMFIFKIDGVMTRQECVPNERIVDHSSTGPVWTWTFAPDETGTTLTLAFAMSTKLPLADKVIDRVSWNGDRDIDTILASMKNGIEK